MRLVLHIDIQVFIWHSDFQTNIHSVLQENIDLYHNSVQFSKIQKYKNNYDLSFNSLNDSFSILTLIDFISDWIS